MSRGSGFLRWLTLYLLLALIVLLLFVDLFGFSSKASTASISKSTKTTIAVHPTSAPAFPTLERYPLTLMVDYNGLLKGSKSAKDGVNQEIQAHTDLKGRRAALVFASGGAPDVVSIQIALQVADKVYEILRSLGENGFIFIRTVFHDPSYILGKELSVVVLEIYLYTQT